MSILLYGMSSPNVVKILVMLEELSLDFDFEHVDLFSEGQFDAAFRALNPNSKVPVLVVDGEQPVFESGAILIYLAERYRCFLPESGRGRYDVLVWLMLQMATVGPLLGQLNHFATYAPADEDYALGRYRREAHRIYSLLDERLEQSAYLVGDSYSIADIAMLPWTDYFERQAIDRSAYPAIGRWRDELEARPAVERARAFITDVVQPGDQQMFARSSPAARRRFMGLGNSTDAPA